MFIMDNSILKDARMRPLMESRLEFVYAFALLVSSC